MKKFIITFLAANLLIISALSLSSCNKKDTNSNPITEEWVPVVCNIINPDIISDRTGNDCPYCDIPIVKCPDDPQWINNAFYCPEHSHVHCFLATDNCIVPEFSECEYCGVRKHYHIVTWTGWYWHGSHTGGGGSCEP